MDGGSSGEEDEMDINLTGQLWGMPLSLIGQAAQVCNISTLPANLTIVNQMAATNTWIIAAIGALGAIFGALAGGLATYIIERLKIKNMDAQRRQQAYSQLYGQKLAYVQCLASYFANFIALEKSYALKDFSLKIPERITINGMVFSTNSIPFDDKMSEKLLLKSDELAQNLAQSGRDLWVVIGLIKLLFKNTEVKIKAIKDLDVKFEAFEDEIKKDQESGLIEFNFELLPRNQLNVISEWPATKEENLKENYIKPLDKSFDKLLADLENEIKSELEDAKKKHWFQFWK